MTAQLPGCARGHGEMDKWCLQDALPAQKHPSYKCRSALAAVEPKLGVEHHRSFQHAHCSPVHWAGLASAGCAESVSMWRLEQFTAPAAAQILQLLHTRAM